jgi:hypothetical protein
LRTFEISKRGTDEYLDFYAAMNLLAYAWAIPQKEKPYSFNICYISMKSTALRYLQIDRDWTRIEATVIAERELENPDEPDLIQPDAAEERPSRYEEVEE